MPIKDLLPITASVKSITYDKFGKKVLTTVYADIPSRIEYTQKLVRDKLGHDIISNSAFFFDAADVATLDADWVITYNSRNYDVVQAQLLWDRVAEHHWEVYCI